MAKDRKDVIVNEIRYWKKNKLLPDKYCDFLIALYTEGESSTFRKKSTSHTSAWLITYYSVNFLLIPLSFIVIYFTENGIILQSLLLTGFACFSFLLQKVMGDKTELHELSLMITLLIILLLTTSFTAYYFPAAYVQGVSLLNAFGWIIIGSRGRRKYISVSGVVLLAGTLVIMMLR